MTNYIQVSREDARVLAGYCLRIANGTGLRRTMEGAKDIADRLKLALSAEPVLPSLPSPPVSGEAVAWLRDAHNGDGDECLVPCAKGDPGGFPVYASPGTNKPVGVTLSIEDVSRLHDLCLAITEFNEGDIFVTRPDFPELIARLSASITGEKG